MPDGRNAPRVDLHELQETVRFDALEPKDRRMTDVQPLLCASSNRPQDGRLRQARCPLF